MLPASDYDGPWKEALDVYFAEILEFFFPAAFAGIDWSHDYEPLDKELQQVAPSGGADQAVDKLVRVRRRDGTDAWVLIHLEVQSQPDTDFAERMFRYHARLYDRFRRQIASLAILGDDRPNWRPRSFGYDLWDCALSLAFPTVKLLDYDLAILEASANPCATVVLAHRLAQATRRDPERRMAAKLTLTRGLYRRGYSREAILQLYRFIDWLLRLPPELEDETWRQIVVFEEEQRMPYITTAERIGRTRGLAEGRAEGLSEGRAEGLLSAIDTLLQARFGAQSVELLPALREVAGAERLQALLARLVAAPDLDEARATIAEFQAANS